MRNRFAPFHRPGAGLAALLLAAACIVFPAHSAPEAKKTQVVSVTYDVADLLYKPGGKSGFDNIEQVIAVVTEHVHPGCWGEDGKENSTIAEFNSAHLEVRTTRANQEEVASLLAALRRQNDVAIDVRTLLYEMDRASYDKLVRPRLGKDHKEGEPLPLAFDDALIGQIRKKAALLKKHSVRLGNRRQGTVFSGRQAFTYQARLAPPNKFATGVTGVTVLASATISPDRQYVHLGLTQKTAEKKGTRKTMFIDPKTGDRIAIDGPRIVETSISASVDVGDGIPVLLPLSYQPASLRSKDRVLLLLVEPAIWIEEEEKERARGRKAG